MSLLLASSGCAVTEPSGAIYAGLLGVLAAGAVALFTRQGRAPREVARVREALAAQLLLDADREALAAALDSAFVRNHRISNATMAAVLNVELIMAMGRDEQPPPAAELAQFAAVARESLGRVRTLIEEGKAAARAYSPPGLAPVSLADVLARAVAAAKARHRGVAIDADPAGAPPALLVRGGADVVERLLAELLDNAAEGDGRRGARHVRLKLRRDDAHDRLGLVVEDDGPGFAPAQLAAAVEPFRTRKEGRTGVGLFIADRLARAQRGTLERSASASGGAAVTAWFALVLPEDTAAPAE